MSYHYTITFLLFLPGQTPRLHFQCDLQLGGIMWLESGQWNKDRTSLSSYSSPRVVFRVLILFPHPSQGAEDSKRRRWTLSNSGSNDSIVNIFIKLSGIVLCSCTLSHLKLLRALWEKCIIIPILYITVISKWKSLVAEVLDMEFKQWSPVARGVNHRVTQTWVPILALQITNSMIFCKLFTFPGSWLSYTCKMRTMISTKVILRLK